MILRKIKKTPKVLDLNQSEDVDVESNVNEFLEEENTIWSAKREESSSPGYVPNNPSFFESEEDSLQDPPLETIPEEREREFRGGCSSRCQCDGSKSTIGRHQGIRPTCYFQSHPFPERARSRPGHRSGPLPGLSRDAYRGGSLGLSDCGGEREAGGGNCCSVRSTPPSRMEHAMGYECRKNPGSLLSDGTHLRTSFFGEEPNTLVTSAPDMSSTSPLPSHTESSHFLVPKSGPSSSYAHMVPPYMLWPPAHRQTLPRFHPYFLNSAYPKPELGCFDVPQPYYDGLRSRYSIPRSHGVPSMYDVRMPPYMPQSSRILDASDGTCPYMLPSFPDVRLMRPPSRDQVYEPTIQHPSKVVLEQAMPDAARRSIPPSSTAAQTSASIRDFREKAIFQENKMDSAGAMADDDKDDGMEIVENYSSGEVQNQEFSDDIEEKINVDS